MTSRLIPFCNNWVPAGWYDLTFDLLDAIDGVRGKSNKFAVTYIKEKFGRLAVYTNENICSGVHRKIEGYSLGKEWFLPEMNDIKIVHTDQFDYTKSSPAGIEIFHLIHSASDKSTKICQRCGSTNDVKFRKKKDSEWIKTLCAWCWEEYVK